MRFRMIPAELEEIQDAINAGTPVPSAAVEALLREFQICDQRREIFERQNELNSDLIKAVASDNRNMLELLAQIRKSRDKLSKRLTAELEVVNTLLAESHRENHVLNAEVERLRSDDSPLEAKE